MILVPPCGHLVVKHRKRPYHRRARPWDLRKIVCAKSNVSIFCIPDYTVGFGVAPNPPLARVADFTAGREFHPALKMNQIFITTIIY
jgi:hypothetical protein